MTDEKDRVFISHQATLSLIFAKAFVIWNAAKIRLHMARFCGTKATQLELTNIRRTFSQYHSLRAL